MREKRHRDLRGRPRRPAPKTLPEDLYDYDDDPVPTAGGRRCNTPLLGPNGKEMRVTDDWPDYVPVTEAEIDVFERWFGDVFDELLSPRRTQNDLHILSEFDKKKP
ncbi:hypothetical protein AAEX31_004697 [Pseudomonas aeruginosa]|nr:hypothetical protein [Pseudomonas aeruginosa]EIU2673178.1 hypothetical protein [Pseudomonas aeruginosa]EIU2723007.1 hypothetical protein [Pseudomonas aeruginosa]EIU3319016.1 hypothetical protein [Pseudomonas aeruginosa]EIU3437538.1 hypothetical protein [Pseudomonas aeruginosa]